MPDQSLPPESSQETLMQTMMEEPVTYQDGETTMKGFVVYDEAVHGKRPGIVMVHEWWGITKHVHTEARKFARQGYTAFIADMYGEGKTGETPNDAGALAGSVMKDPMARAGTDLAAVAGFHATTDLHNGHLEFEFQ